MTYSRVVITCGVSLFGGGNAFRKWTEDKRLLAFPSGSSFPNPIPPGNKSETEALAELRRQISYPAALAGIVTDEKRVSAEYSALAALNAEAKLAQHSTVVLIHTKTMGGQAAAIILGKLISDGFGATVECLECSLNVDDREQLRYDLGNFMQKVATALRGHSPYTTRFFPLGGYKVMTSLGCLAGGYFGFPTLYLHEEKQIFHEIPGVPWKLSPEALQSLAPVIKHVGNGLAVADLTATEREYIASYAWLFERADDLVCVNAFGLFLMQENPSLFGTKLLVSNAVDAVFGSDGRRPFIVQQLGVLSAKLAAGSNERELNHETDWPRLPANDGWHLYKGTSNGQLVMRAIYKMDGDKLEVKCVWTNHKKYEDEFIHEWQRPQTGAVEWSLA